MSNFLAQHAYAIGEPIVALATPFGKSALAIIRISGEGSISLFKSFFSHPDSLNRHAKMRYGFFINGEGQKIDEVMVTVFHSPLSYTGEESLEISTHGSMTIVNQILSNLLNSGFRMALPGEFTYRAYLLGKIDLIQAEAVHELIDAQSSTASSAALGRLEGDLSVHLMAIYRQTLDLLAPLNAHLDYPQEDLEPLPLFNVDTALADLNELMEQSSHTMFLKKGAQVVLAGVPNAGKSSLFNALLAHDRAIVSPIAGATRDYIEEQIELGGMLISLIDTAGLRHGENELEQMGIDRSVALLEKSDLILYIISADDPVITDDIKGFEHKTLWIANKCDLAQAPDHFIALSAEKREGIKELKQAIMGYLKIDTINSKKNKVLLGSLRQEQLCRQALDSLNQFKNIINNGSVDELAYYAKIASHALAQLLGKDSDREAIESMFSQFCLGK